MTPASSPYEVAIVGAGITGVSIAWQLARRGVRCVIFDKVGVGAGATGLQPGGVRTQWGRRATTEFAQESLAFYRDFRQRTGASQDPQLVPCGYVFVASTEATMSQLAGVVETQNELGIGTRVLNSQELDDLVPGLDLDGITGASFNPEDGYMNLPGAPVAGFSEAAVRSGAEIVVDRVEAITATHDQWTLTLKSGNSLTVPTVVIAAGPATTQLVESADLTVPITAEPRYLFYSNPIHQRLIEPLVIFQDEHFAVKHLADGSVLASDLSIRADETPNESAWRRNVTSTARRLAPILSYVQFPVMVTGQYDVTPDTEFALGSFSQAPGLVVAAGMNGRGMMLAPSVSRVMADFVINRNTEVIPEDMRVERFTAEFDGARGVEAMVI